MSDNETIYSEVNVYLCHISLKGKWYYDSCPNLKCKKSADSYTFCLYCNTEIKEVQSRFILPIELSDYCGSVWTTAFDEFGQQIFKDRTISDLKKLTEN
jgi:hypothetical protein